MIERLLSPTLVQSLGWTLIHTLWQAAVFALALGGLLILLRKYSARARYLVCVATLAGFVLTALLTFVNLYRNVPPGETSTNVVADIAFFERATEEESGHFRPGLMVAPVDWRIRVEEYFDGHLPLIVTLWLLGVLTLQLRFLGRLAYLQRLRNYGVESFAERFGPLLRELEERLGVTRKIDYLSSLRVDSPFTFGWLRPVILFPERLLSELREPELRTILAHELAHVQRHDFAVNLAQTLACILFFYHPAVWWMSARAADEREHACDDLAVGVTGERIGYAKTLIRLKEAEMRPALAMAATGRRGGFSHRVERLLSGYLGLGTFGEGFTSAAIIFSIVLVGVTLSGNGEGAMMSGDVPPEKNHGYVPPPPHPVVPPPPPVTPPPPPPVTPPPPPPVAPPRGTSTVAPRSTRGTSTVAPADAPEELSEISNVEELLSEYDDEGRTPLHYAAKTGELQVVRYLLKLGLAPNAPDAEGRTPLHFAAREGRLDVVDVLIRAGAQDLADYEDKRALHFAAMRGRSGVVAYLMLWGSNPNAVDHELRTALHFAAFYGKSDVVRQLLAAGADPEARDHEGRTPLVFAVAQRQTRVVEYLRGAR